MADKGFRSSSTSDFKDPKIGNVLNNYRSYTYNFTLSALPKAISNDPKKYESGSAPYTVLKSGGKGTTGVAGPSAAQVADMQESASTDMGDAWKNAEASQKNIDSLKFNADLVPGFNKNSPGRFDMFFDKFEITTSHTPSEKIGFISQGNIRFTVVEPYSINGFIEAMHVAAVSAGYVNSINATYLLTLKFYGYPDNDQPEYAGPEEVPFSTRSWPIVFQSIGLEATEKGVVYNCNAFEAGGLVAADSNNQLKKSITFEGIKLQDALAGPLASERPANYAGNDFVTKINILQKDSVKNRTDGDIYDEYRVFFPELSDTGLDYTKVNKIGQTKLTDTAQLLRSGGMEDPQTTEKKTNYKNNPEDNSTSTQPIKLDPSTGKYQLQFAQGTNISELITNTVRDSEYIANLVKALKENPGSVIDKNGYVEYFRIATEVEQSDTINPETKKPKSTFKYSVIPFKTHVSNIKGIPPTLWDPKKYVPFVVRAYDYMYTGKNTDVISFKMMFNMFYHAAVPYELNNDIIQSSIGAAPGNSTDITFNNPTSSNDAAQLQNGVLTSRPASVPYVPADGPGAPKSDNAYRNLSRFIHSQFLNYAESGQQLSLDIIGDPLYISTNGFNGYYAGPAGAAFTQNGEADFITYQVPVSINFRNPIDIGKSGFMDFSEEQVPYSGIYQVTSINNFFSEGVFKQRLMLIRIPGQLEGKSIKVKDYSDLFEESANPFDQITTDTTDGAPNVAGKVSDATIKRLGGTVLSNLGKAAALVGAAGLLKNISGQAATALAASLAVPAVLNVAKSAIDTVNGLASKATGLIGNVNQKVASAPNVSAGTDPTNNITAAAKQGVPVDILTQDKLENIPKAAPPATAPSPPVDVATLESLYKSGGPAAIAKAYGVKDITKISPTDLPLDTLKTIENSVALSNPLSALKKVVAQASSGIDTSIVTDKLASAQTLLNSAQSVVTIIPRDASQATSILTQAGSNVTSPLTKILQG